MSVNGNPKRPWRHGGGGERGSNSQNRKAPGRGRGSTSQNNGSKKDDKIYKFVPFTRHTASTHHNFKDTKEAFIRAISLKLGEYAQDVRKAVQDEAPHVFAIPARGQARPSILPQPVQPPAQADPNALTAAAL